MEHAIDAGRIASKLMRYFLTSIVLLVPCFWLPRIHAGDLSSHVYNAWLESELKAGRAPGLYLANQWTNIVFDRMLAYLLPLTGADWAQRISVSVCVLVFFWGLFEWIRAQSGDAWTISPALMMLTYGRLFHIGFFNFYLALGLAFVAFTLLWRGSAWRLIGLILLVISVFAHALGPFLVAFATLVLWLGRSARSLLFLSGSAVSILVVLAGRLLRPQWFVVHSALISPEALGLSQFRLYGWEFEAITVALITVLLMMLAVDSESIGASGQLKRGECRLLLLSLVLSAMTPWAVWLPGFPHALGYLDLRVSFLVAMSLILVCSQKKFQWGWWVTLAAVAVGYFSFLYLRLSTVDTIESKVETAIKQVPRGARVVSAMRLRNESLDPLRHMVDRTCVGHCYSYANYEPPSKAFRLRSNSMSPIVVANNAKVAAIDSGRHVFEACELPVWVLYCPSVPAEEVLVRQLTAGEKMPLQPFTSEELTEARQRN